MTLHAPQPTPKPVPYVLNPDDPDASYLTLEMIQPATRGLVQLAQDLVIQDLIVPLQNAMAALRKENADLTLVLAELKAELAGAKAKIEKTDFVVERLSIDRQGPPGSQGLRGRDGADGRPGPAGPKGSRGQKSEICAWQLDIENYRAVPIFQDDTCGPALNLSGFFEAYNHAVEDDEVSLATERAALNRAELELEITRIDHGLPRR
jgi:hypothetical protein